MLRSRWVGSDVDSGVPRTIMVIISMFWCVMRIERETAKALVVGQLVWVVADQRLVSVNFSDTGTNVVTPVYDVRSPAPSMLLYLKLVLSNAWHLLQHSIPGSKILPRKWYDDPLLLPTHDEICVEWRVSCGDNARKCSDTEDGGTQHTDGFPVLRPLTTIYLLQFDPIA